MNVVMYLVVLLIISFFILINTKAVCMLIKELHRINHLRCESVGNTINQGRTIVVMTQYFLFHKESELSATLYGFTISMTIR